MNDDNRRGLPSSFAPADADNKPCGAWTELASSILSREAKDVIRQFDTGATRDSDTDKLDFEGFLHPDVLYCYARYMHKHRIQTDGTLRASDNWQNGIPKEVYMKSMFRHFMEVWFGHRKGTVNSDSLCALLFNVMGYLSVILAK